jgi:hypothetical protein
MAIHSQRKHPEPRVFIETAPTPAPVEPKTTKTEPTAEPTAPGPVVRDPSPADTRTYRVGTIWSLLAFSLLPGLLARATPELWAGLPAAWHWGAYICSGVSLVAATILIVRPVDARRP